MTTDTALSPAEQASEAALTKIRQCLAEGKSFLLEAGAGAGKTYSLIETLKHLINERGNELVNKHQQIACITYTNVAADEITSRTDSHPAIYSSTIHHFCWSLIKDFQPFLRANLVEAHRTWPEKIEEAEGVHTQAVIYDLGYRKIDDKKIMLHHDDVLSFMVMLLDEPKFQNLFSKRYPVLFVDEYQDTEATFAESLKRCFLDSSNGPLIGFFGDHWQKIYGSGCGKIEHPNLEIIGKEANFRSVPVIVDTLNRIRPSLPQQVCDPNAEGAINVFHTNNWMGTRRTENHWQGDLPAEDAHSYLESLKIRLEGEGWKFSPDKTRVLMLTHNVLAQEQGYRNLSGVFRYNEAFIKKEDRHIAFMVDTLEPVCTAYVARRYGEMFSLLGRRTPLMASRQEKDRWARGMDALLVLREKGTVGEVINHLRQTRQPRLSEGIENKERRLQEWLEQAEGEREESRSLSELSNLRAIAYSEVIALTKFLNDSTPFNTKHGVKGAEFENVMVVCGRGWNHYNFNQFLEWAGDNVPANKQDTFERNRNLFYVACSRAKKRLCLLFTQELDEQALQTLSSWFGEERIIAA
ncbi:MAG: UvrD-helicase domain-containing protein [Rickettsiales bacterium]|nr:UvrD-helicase domain-containing protein [Rickettsiales bacterium]